MNKDNGQAIPFIVYNKKLGFQITDESIEFLSLIKENFGVISIVGKYRTGKSYFINKVILNTNNGFQVGPSINACTKGLWIWNKLIYNEENNRNYILIDTEGFGGINEGTNHDTKIFLFSMLLSSFFIYNSVGAINENALQNLSLIINLTKQVKMNEKENNNEDELIEQFPFFMWIVRDFSLKLIDENNNEISSKDYLENILKKLNGISDEIESKNQLRRLIKHFFNNRDCFTMVRPVESEKNLQNLDNLSNDSLRKEFQDQVNIIRLKIFRKCKNKILKRKFINGNGLIQMANAYKDSINKGEIVHIENAWTYICRNENENIINDIIKEFKIILENNIDFSDEVLNQYETLFIKQFEEENLNNNVEKIEYCNKLKIKLKEIFIEKKKKYNYLLNKKILEYLDNEFNNYKLNLFNEYDELLDYNIIEKNFFELLENCRKKFLLDINNFEKIIINFKNEKLKYLLEFVYKETKNKNKIFEEKNNEEIKILKKEIEFNNTQNNDNLTNYKNKIINLENELINLKTNFNLKNKEFDNLLVKYKILENNISDIKDNKNNNKISYFNEIEKIKKYYENELNNSLKEKNIFEKDLALKNQEITFLEKDKTKLNLLLEKINQENFEIKNNNSQLLNDKNIIQTDFNKINDEIKIFNKSKFEKEINIKDEIIKELEMNNKILNNQIDLIEKEKNDNNDKNDILLEIKNELNNNSRIINYEKKINKYDIINSNSLYIICSNCKEKFSNGLFYNHLLQCIPDIHILNNNEINHKTKFVITQNNQYDNNDFSSTIILEINLDKNSKFLKKEIDDFYDLIFELENEFPKFYFPKSINKLMNVYNDLDELLESENINFCKYKNDFEILLNEINKNNILRQSKSFINFLK